MVNVIPYFFDKPVKDRILGLTALYSRKCVIKEYQYNTMSLSHYHGCCQSYESTSAMSPCLPSVHVYSMSPCLYPESMSIPWIHVYTVSPCLYYKSMFVKWVLINSMHPWQKDFFFYRNTFYRNREIQIIGIQTYKLQKYRNTSYRNTEIQITDIQIYKIQKYRNKNYRRKSKL